MNVVHLLLEFVSREHIEPMKPSQPERPLHRPLRNRQLQRMHSRRKISRLTQQEMDMLRHDHVGKDRKPMPNPSLL